MSDRPDPLQSCIALAMLALILAAILALPPMQWRLGVSLAKADISIGFDVGAVRFRTPLSDSGQDGPA